MTKKCIIFGVDGASPDLIERWSMEGELPNFRKIIVGGAYGKLKSTVPPLTPCAWSSFMTGKNPGKHGIYDFFYLDGEQNIKLNTSQTRESMDLWEYLTSYGYKSLVFNVPFTYPPKKINGIMVTDFTTPSTEVNFTYPDYLKDEILNKYPNFRFSEDAKYSEREKDKKAFFVDLMDLADMQYNIFSELAKKDDFDFYVMVFMLTDHAQHWYWKYFDKDHPEYEKNGEFEVVILKAYQKADYYLGKLIKKFPEANIIIMSDHGGRPYYKDVSINKWLIDNGYLSLKDEKSLIKRIISKIGINNLITFGLNIGLWSIIKKFPKLKDTIQNKLIPSYQDIDWSKTLAYSYGYYGPIYFNKSKINSETEQKDLEKEITNKLQHLKNPYNGDYLEKKTWKTNELYKGGYITLLPDLILNMGDFSYGSSSTFLFSSNELFSEPKTFKSGDHSIHGVLMAYGPDIKPGVKVRNAEIYDLAPTILYTHGVPIPKDMDGRILKEIFKKDGLEGVKRKRIFKKDKIKSKIKKLKAKNII